MSEHDYGAFKEGEEVDSGIGANAMAQLTGLASDQLAAEALIANLEAQLAEAKKALKLISETQLPDLMDSLEIEKFSTKSGISIKIKEDVFGSISQGNAEKAFKWLEDHNHGRLVKRTFLVEFNKEEEAWADKFERDCAQRKRPLHLERKKDINPQTLKAFVRGQLAQGVEIPLKEFGVHRQRISKVELKG